MTQFLLSEACPDGRVVSVRKSHGSTENWRNVVLERRPIFSINIFVILDPGWQLET